MTDEKIKMINYYAKKERESGLTPDEKRDQVRLRQEYVAAFRSNLRSQLENVVFVDENGNQRKAKKKT